MTSSAEHYPPIVDTPVFHWFVVSVIVFGLVMSTGASWWLQGILWAVLAVRLSSNSAFRLRTTVRPVERVVHFARFTLFGWRTQVVAFDAVSEVRIQMGVWGNRDSRQLRGTLKVCTLNQAFDVIYLSRDLSRMTSLAAAMRDALGLEALTDERPQLEAPTTLSETQLEALEALCSEAWDGDRIVGPDAVSEQLRETLSASVGIPPTEPLWCYVDTAMALKGQYGLVIGAHGLYWANDGDLKEHTRITRLSWRELGEATLALDPQDDDIMVGTTSQIGRGVFADTERLLALLHGLQAVVTATGAPTPPASEP